MAEFASIKLRAAKLNVVENGWEVGCCRELRACVRAGVPRGGLGRGRNQEMGGSSHRAAGVDRHIEGGDPGVYVQEFGGRECRSSGEPGNVDKRRARHDHPSQFGPVTIGVVHFNVLEGMHRLEGKGGGRGGRGGRGGAGTTIRPRPSPTVIGPTRPAEQLRDHPESEALTIGIDRPTTELRGIEKILVGLGELRAVKGLATFSVRL
jgi:hypothetical protein